ncbi:MAG: acyl carrier protein [Candidatus Solibacter sp.]
MTRIEFLRQLEGHLEVKPGSLEESQRLSELVCWDSMAAVVFIALADEQLGVTVSGDQIEQAKSVHDLLSLVRPGLV